MTNLKNENYPQAISDAGVIALTLKADKCGCNKAAAVRFSCRALIIRRICQWHGHRNSGIALSSLRCL